MDSSQPNNPQEPAVNPVLSQTGTPANPPGAPTVANNDVQSSKTENETPNPETQAAPAPVAPSAALGGTTQAIPVAVSTPPETDEPPVAPPDDAAKPKQAKLLTAHASNRPMGAIIAAILIAILLAGLTVFAYLKTKDADSKPAKTSTSNSTSAPAVTPEDVDKTNQDVDNSLNSIDNQDLNGDLSDSALGL